MFEVTLLSADVGRRRANDAIRNVFISFSRMFIRPTIRPSKAKIPKAVGWKSPRNEEKTPIISAISIPRRNAVSPIFICINYHQ